MNDLKVTVLLLSYNQVGYLKECIDSLKLQTYKRIELVLLDNNSPDESVKFVKENYPDVVVKDFKYNYGYAGANNIGMKEAFSSGSDLVILMNCDIYADPDMIEKMVMTYKDKFNEGVKVGLIQPVILLHDSPDLLNSAGNSMHFLGFGFCKDYKKVYKGFSQDVEIMAASGACMLVSRAYYEEIGELDTEFFMYNEDQNYAWRGLMRGYTHYLSAKAVMKHKYRYSSYAIKMYHSDKNRMMMFFENYSIFTIIVLLPAFIFTEVALVTYSLLSGWFKEKFKANLYILNNIPLILKVRKKVQSSRTIPDEQLFRKFSYDIDFEATNSPITRYVMTPIYKCYYDAVKKFYT